MKGLPLACALALLAACPPPGELSITTESLPAGNVDSAYSALLQTEGGTPPLRFSSPPGHSRPAWRWTRTQASARGTPVEPGFLTFTARATDARGAQADRALSIRVFPNPPPRITTTDLRSAVVGKPYTLGLQAVDGKAPYAWSLGAGALPPGLALEPSGVVDGSAGAQSSGAVELLATDQNAQVARATLPISAYLEIRLSPAALPDGYTDTPYSVTFTATGGLPPYTYELVGGSWPDGLGLVAPGHLAGTPSTPGTWTCSVSARDESGQAPSVRYTVAVHAPPRVTTTTLPDAQKDMAYAGVIAAAGGKAPLSFAVTGGSLPSGLSLGGDGRFTGAPSVTGAFTFTVQATDANGRATSPAPLALSVL